MLENAPDEIFQYFGFTGVAFYLGSYAALQFGFIRGNSYTYTLLNLAAAVCVLISLTHAFNLSSALIQISWIGISIYGMSRVFILNHAIRFTEEERDFLNRKLSELSKISARNFLRAGKWVDAPSGAQMTSQGKPHGVLRYLASGGADVFVANENVGSISAGEFLGEITALDGAPATATVTLTAPSRLFAIDMSALKKLSSRDVELQMALANSMNNDTRAKLDAANRKLELNGGQ